MFVIEESKDREESRFVREGTSSVEDITALTFPEIAEFIKGKVEDNPGEKLTFEVTFYQTESDKPVYRAELVG